MLLGKLSLETFVKNVPRKMVANNNRTENLLKSLPLEMFVKKCVAKCLRKNTKKECC